MLFTYRGYLPAVYYLIENLDPNQSHRWSKVSDHVYFSCTCHLQLGYPKVTIFISKIFNEQSPQKFQDMFWASKQRFQLIKILIDAFEPKERHFTIFKNFQAPKTAEKTRPNNLKIPRRLAFLSMPQKIGQKGPKNVCINLCSDPHVALS